MLTKLSLYCRAYIKSISLLGRRLFRYHTGFIGVLCLCALAGYSAGWLSAVFLSVRQMQLDANILPISQLRRLFIEHVDQRLFLLVDQQKIAGFIKKHNSWIDQVWMRVWPPRLVIERVTRKTPVWIWQHENFWLMAQGAGGRDAWDKIVLLDEFGCSGPMRLTKSDPRHSTFARSIKNMILIKAPLQDARKVLEMSRILQTEYNEKIIWASLIGDRRWDILLQGYILMLPQEDYIMHLRQWMSNKDRILQLVDEKPHLVDLRISDKVRLRVDYGQYSMHDVNICGNNIYLPRKHREI